MYQNKPTFGAAGMPEGLMGGMRGRNSPAGMSDHRTTQFDSGEGVIADDSGMSYSAVMPDNFDGGMSPAIRRQAQLQKLARPTDDGYNQQRQQMSDQLQLRAQNTFSQIPAYGQMQALQGKLQGRQPSPEEQQQLKMFDQQIKGDPSYRQLQQQEQQMQNPFMGGGGFGGQQGGYGQQMQNPFMGGGGFGSPQGGYGQQMQNPFMGGGGFGGYGVRQGGYGQQMQNPFMGGGMGGYGQQMQNPFMGGGGYGGQQMQQPMQLQRSMGPAPQLPMAQPQPQPQPQPAQQQQPMGYQGGAF